MFVHRSGEHIVPNRIFVVSLQNVRFAAWESRVLEQR